jgi:type I restriction enzyme S subunit
MDAYQPYPEYKDSGVEWLGQIPAHWEVRRLKFAAPQVNAKLSAKPSEKIYLGLENIESGTGQILFDSLSDNVESIVATFQPGDILFGKLRPYLAKVIHADFDGVCTTELLVLRPIRPVVEGRFLFYMLLSHNFINIVDSMTYGAKMPRANATQIGNLPASFPPLPEQRAIAAFLDRETAHIDALIARKRELIDLLHRQRTAIISHAVTKGLDPAVPLKDSGIEWLGQIPAHWEVLPVKFRYEVQLGKMLQSKPSSALDTLEPYIRAANIEWGKVNLSDVKEMWFSPQEKRKYALRYGDLPQFLCPSGMRVKAV